MTMITQIGGHFEEYVQGQIDSGRYGDPAEVVRDALRLMEARDNALALRKDELREKIAVGYQDLQEGRHCDGDEIFAQLDAEDRALLNSSK